MIENKLEFQEMRGEHNLIGIMKSENLKGGWNLRLIMKKNRINNHTVIMFFLIVSHIFPLNFNLLEM